MRVPITPGLFFARPKNENQFVPVLVRDDGGLVAETFEYVISELSGLLRLSLDKFEEWREIPFVPNCEEFLGKLTEETILDLPDGFYRHDTTGDRVLKFGDLAVKVYEEDVLSHPVHCAFSRVEGPASEFTKIARLN